MEDGGGAPWESLALARCAVSRCAPASVSHHVCLVFNPAFGCGYGWPPRMASWQERRTPARKMSRLGHGHVASGSPTRLLCWSTSPSPHLATGLVGAIQGDKQPEIAPGIVVIFTPLSSSILFFWRPS